MNLVSLEEHFFFSGGKTGKTGFFDLITIVREMRQEFMERLIGKPKTDDGEKWCISKHLLAASMRVMEVGTKAQGAGKKEDAANLFKKAYELYSLFWGINMGLIDLNGVQKDESLPKPLREWIGDVATAEKTETKPQQTPANKGLLSNLGEWVKKSVNCCIE